jgi:hypothetical protein
MRTGQKVDGMHTDPQSSLGVLSPEVKARRFLVLLPAIEAKLREGVRHEDIIHALNAHGLELSRNTYFSYLRRFRAKGRKPQAAPSVLPPSKEGGDGPGRRPPTFDYDPRGIPDLLK